MALKTPRTIVRASLFWLYLFLYILFSTKFSRLFLYFCFSPVPVKNQNILNDDASHFKLAAGIYVEDLIIWIRKPSVFKFHFYYQ